MGMLCTTIKHISSPPSTSTTTARPLHLSSIQTKPDSAPLKSWSWFLSDKLLYGSFSWYNYSWEDARMRWMNKKQARNKKGKPKVCPKIGTWLWHQFFWFEGQSTGQDDPDWVKAQIHSDASSSPFHYYFCPEHRGGLSLSLSLLVMYQLACLLLTSIPSSQIN